MDTRNYNEEDEEILIKRNRDKYEAEQREKANQQKLVELNKERALDNLPPLPELPSVSSTNDKNVKKPEIKGKIEFRKKKLNLEANLGKQQLVQATNSNLEPGFYCEICDCTLKDSDSFVEHLNGKKHLINAGISLKQERSTLSQVKAKLEEMKKRKNAPKNYDLEERLEQYRRQEEEAKEKKKLKKLNKKKEQEFQGDDYVASMMGFGAFGGSKKA